MKLKATLAAMALVLPMVLAPAADARGLRWADQVRIEQDGRNNGAAASQSGVANGSTIVQRGNDSFTQTTQTGNNNNVHVDSRGNANSAAVNQSGNNNNMCLLQRGSGLSAVANQTGNQNMAVLQTSQGANVLPVDICYYLRRR